MPAPVYVAVAGAVIGIAAVIAFKEFVYDPHIAPYVAEGRRQARNRRQRTGPVAAHRGSDAESDDDDDRPLMPRPGGPPRSPNDLGPGGSDSMSVELQDLVAGEQAGWRSSSIDHGTLRRRGTAARSATVLDESNVFVPYDPISPTQVTSANTSATSSPMSSRAGPSLYGMTQISSPPVIHSPLPRTPINTSRLRSSVKVESPTTSPQPRSPPGTRTTLSPRVVSPAETETTRSGSSASSFTPAVIGPPSHGTSPVGSDFARSPTLSAHAASRSGSASPFVAVPAAVSPFSDALGLATQPYVTLSPSSPFTDIAHPLSPGFNRSPSPVLLSPQDSSLHLPSESETARLSPSLRSGMFSPSMSSVDDQFEIASDFGSELDDWSSVGRRTPSP